MTVQHDHSGFAEFGCQACEAAHAEAVETAEQEFLDASIAVWRQIDAAEAGPLYAEGRRDREVYQGLEAGTELRQREKAAWERYRDLLGGAG